MGREYAEQSRIYGTLPVRGNHWHPQDGRHLHASNQVSEGYYYKRESLVSKGGDRQLRYNQGYHRSCQEILRRSQQNLQQSSLPPRGFPLNNHPYSRHSVAVMDFHPYHNFPPSESIPTHVPLYPTDWKPRDQFPVIRQPLYKPKTPREHQIKTLKTQPSRLTATLASRYPLHTVAENDQSMFDVEKQLEIFGNKTMWREKDTHIPTDIDKKATTLMDIYNPDKASSPVKKKKVSLTLCKAACLFLVISNLFFVLIIGCVVFSE